jgi:exonuclease SbcD
VKCLLTGDLQLEAGLPLGTGTYGPGSRFNDQVDVLDRIVDLAVAEQVDIVFVLGDIFEHARPQPFSILAFQGFVRRLLAAGIRVFTCLGNHDCQSAAVPSALEIFGQNGCVVALQPSIYPLDAADPEDGIVIAALPWTAPGNIIAALPDEPRENLNDAAAQALVRGAQTMAVRCQSDFPHLTPILVGHWAVSGAALPTGLDTAMLREPVIPLEEINNLGYSLVALSHIHRGQVLCAAPSPVVYTGSPQVNSWGETEGEHGVWIYDSRGDGHLKFHPVEDRKFLTLDFQHPEVPVLEPADGVEGALVRVRYTADEATARTIDQSAIRRDILAMGARKVFFQPTIERAVRARVAEMAPDMSEVAAMELWIAEQNGSLACDPELLRLGHAEFLERLH